MVALAGDKLDECRRRTQRETTGRRGRKDDPLYKARRLLRTGAGLVTDSGWDRLEQLFADPQNTPVQTAWAVHQKIMAAYRAKTPAEGKTRMDKVMQTLTTGVPDALEELASLGKTLAQRRDDILAYFGHPGTSNGPTENTNAPPGTPTRHRPGLPKPDQLHHPQPHPRRRLPQPATTPLNTKSPITLIAPMVLGLMPLGVT